MQPETENAINSTARAALKEYFNKSNALTYRQILDKYAPKIEMLIPAEHRCRAWMWLNSVCHRLVKNKGVKT